MRHRSIRRGPARRRLRPGVEAVEPRRLLSASIDTIANLPAATAGVTVPAGKSLIVPITATDSDGRALTYTVTSSNPQVTPVLHAGNSFLKLSVQGFGDLTFELLGDVAPNTVNTISGLVNRGFYNGLTFHRVIPNFVIQGGDPRGDGSGGPGFQYDDELKADAIFSGNGQLALANAGHDTNGSQFFVTVGPQRNLDFGYTLLGQLVRGFDVLNAIDRVPTSGSTGSPADRPLAPVVITSAAIVADPTDAVLTLVAAPGAGPAAITVNVDDGRGGTATRTFQASVAADAINDPPFLNPVPPDATTTPGTPVSFTLSAADLEHDPLIYGGEFASPADATKGGFTTSGNVVTFTPAAGVTGPLHILLAVGDYVGNRLTNPEYYSKVVNVVAQILTPHGATFGAIKGVALNHVTVATFAAAVPGAAADYAATIAWGDGTVTAGTVAPAAGGGYAVTGSHTYAAAGTEVTTVTIADRARSVSTLAQGSAVVAIAPQHAAGDHDGDGRTDVGVYDPTVATFAYVASGSGQLSVKPFGFVGHGNIPLNGDYEGTGKVNVGIYDPTSATFAYVSNLDGRAVVQTFGFVGHGNIPLAGDYEGTGRTNLGIYDERAATFAYVSNVTGQPVVQAFGFVGDVNIPLAGDYEGTGRANLGIYDETAATFAYVSNVTGRVVVTPFGYVGHRTIPLTGDFDGAGHAEIAIYDPTNSTFAYIAKDGAAVARPFGTPGHGDVPLVGDFDGTGRTNIGIYDPTVATFAYLSTVTGRVVVKPFGYLKHGDIPNGGAPPDPVLPPKSAARAASAAPAAVLATVIPDPAPARATTRRAPAAAIRPTPLPA